MFKTLLSDRKKIERKYHNPDEEYNPYRRWFYHGYDYDEATGLSDEEIDEGLSVLSKKFEGLPRPIHKARLFEYVLDNTRIDVAEHDYFIGMYTWDRPISQFTVNRWSEEVYGEFPEEAAVLKDLRNAGAVYGKLDFEHTVPDWDSLMEMGIPGLLKRAEECYKRLDNPTEKQTAFFEGIQIEYKAVIRFIDRLYQYALTKDFEKAPKIASCLKNLRDGAPSDTYEALQLMYIYFMLSESIDHYQVRALGYGLDGTLYPFFKKDMESGRYTKEEIGEFIGYFLMQWSAIDNYWGQPMYLGGMNVDGSTKVNELSYLIMDVYDRMGIYNPKIQIKINKSTPKDFVLKALEMIRHGVSSIVFCNDDTIIKCLMARGATYEEAVDSVLSGCYEYKVKAKGIGLGGGFFSALKPISLVFDNGFDSVSGKQIGPKTGEIEEFSNFSSFYKAYLKQLEHIIITYFKAFDVLATKINQINPSLLFSGTIIDCVGTMTDALDCGLENTTDSCLSGLGSAVDALMVVYELVYEKKITTLEQLKLALDNNWDGFEILRAKALNCKHKYGNGDAMADNYAAAIMRLVHDVTAGMKNSHGAGYNWELHSARAFVIHGEKTKATPDGRMSGQETSKNASPTPGADRKGITALIKSATHIDTTIPTNGFCLDAMLHPSAVQGEEGEEAFYAVLNTYMNKGGASIHFNIFDADMLIDAQNHPENYKNLQVRVCGWNILWNNMDKKEQDEYILRAKNIL